MPGDTLGLNINSKGVQQNSFDAIVIGVRAYNTNERMKFHQPKLIEYVNNGGTVVMQYNTNQKLLTTDLGPYPFKLSRERVTVARCGRVGRKRELRCDLLKRELAPDFEHEHLALLAREMADRAAERDELLVVRGSGKTVQAQQTPVEDHQLAERILENLAVGGSVASRRDDCTAQVQQLAARVLFDLQPKIRTVHRDRRELRVTVQHPVLFQNIGVLHGEDVGGPLPLFRSEDQRRPVTIGDTITVTFTVRNDAQEEIDVPNMTSGSIYVSGPSFNYQRVIASQSPPGTTSTPSTCHPARAISAHNAPPPAPISIARPGLVRRSRLATSFVRSIAAE